MSKLRGQGSAVVPDSSPYHMQGLEGSSPIQGRRTYPYQVEHVLLSGKGFLDDRRAVKGTTVTRQPW